MLYNVAIDAMLYSVASNAICYTILHVGCTEYCTSVVSNNAICYTRGEGTPLYGLYGDVPLDRVWFLASSALNRIYNFMRTCPKQGMFFLIVLKNRI